MSLLDFDDDDIGTNATVATDADFYGHKSAIDDPFGFDVFGTVSTGSMKTEPGTTAATSFSEDSKGDNLFNDFDPFSNFGNCSNNVTTTVSNSWTTSSSVANADKFDAFCDSSYNDPSVVTQTFSFQSTTNTQSWAEGAEDSGSSNHLHKGSFHLDDNDCPKASPEEEMTEVTSVMTETSMSGGDGLRTWDGSSTEPHNNGSSLNLNEAISLNDAKTVDKNMSDSYFKIAPENMKDDHSSVKLMDSLTFETNSQFDISDSINSKDISVFSEAIVDTVVPEISPMLEKNKKPRSNEKEASTESSVVDTNGYTATISGFADNADLDDRNMKNYVLEATSERAESVPEEDEVHSSKEKEFSVEKLNEVYIKEVNQLNPNAFQHCQSQDVSVIASINHHDDPRINCDLIPSTPENIYSEIYSNNKEHKWKLDDSAEKDDDIQFEFKRQPGNSEFEGNSHRDHEDDSLSSYFSLDDRKRGRINIEEIRQRSYEDIEQMNNFSSHDQNQKEKKTIADKAPLIYFSGAASDSTCKVCAKRVYEMEKITADLQVYHKTCFRCSHCNRILGLGNFSTNDGHLYCKPHFIEIFKTKGNYKESFAAAERQKQLNDRQEATDDHMSSQGRHSSEDNEISRTRHTSSSSGREDIDEADVAGISEEEIPVVQIKSVRSIFEKMSQDQSSVSGHPKKVAETFHTAQTIDKGQWKQQTEQLRRDSLKSERDREPCENAQRKDSLIDREVVQSSTTCIVEEELPPPSFTKSMLAKFKMMEDIGGCAKMSANYGKSMPNKQTSSYVGNTGSHQTLAYRSSTGSQGSNEARSEPYQFIEKTEIIHPSTEEPLDELPQAGLAKSLLAQWQNLEEQSKRGRNKEPKKTNSARRSQSMSRVENVQRANVYRNIEFSSPRLKQEEDIIRRAGSYSDQELSEDDSPVSMPTRQSLAKFKELEGGQSLHETDSFHKMKRKFKWEVKEAVPLNRGGIIVHGDIPKRPVTEDAAVIKWSESLADDGGVKRESDRTTRNDSESRGDYSVNSDVVQSTVTVVNEDELPPPATTKTLLQHFKSMEDLTKAPPLPGRSPSEAAREVCVKTRSTIPSVVNSDNDYEDDAHRAVVGTGHSKQKQSINSDSEDFQYDYTTHDHHNVVKESDACDVELPAQGTTRSLLAKFQSLQTKK